MCDQANTEDSPRNYDAAAADLVLAAAKCAYEEEQDRFRQTEQKLGFVLAYAGVLIALLASALLRGVNPSVAVLGFACEAALVLSLIFLLLCICFAFLGLKPLTIERIDLSDVVTDNELTNEPSHVAGRLARTYSQLVERNDAAIDRKAASFDRAVLCAVVGTGLATLGFLLCLSGG